MTIDDEDSADRNQEPGPDVTPKLFRQWQKARRGHIPAEDIANPVWRWLFRGRIDPFHANERIVICRHVLGGGEPKLGWLACAK